MRRNSQVEKLGHQAPAQGHDYSGSLKEPTFIEQLLCARHPTKSRACICTFTHHSNPVGTYSSGAFLLTNKDVETERDEVLAQGRKAGTVPS